MEKEIKEIKILLDDLASSVARGFEEAERDRNEIKGSLSILGLKVDNYHDQMSSRVGIIENRLGMGPIKPKKISK